jgi:hypothetical protein
VNIKQSINQYIKKHFAKASPVSPFIGLWGILVPPVITNSRWFTEQTTLWLLGAWFLGLLCLMMLAVKIHRQRLPKS